MRISHLRRTGLAALMVSLLLVMLAGPASAHDPIFLDDTQTTPDTGPFMPDGSISWALYGQVLSDGDTRGFEFDLREGDELYISLLIPNLEPETLLPEDELPVLQLEAPDGTVRTIVPDMRVVFDEEFSRTSYMTLTELREPGQGGRYRGLVVGTAPARFTVAIGETEIFFTETERSGERPTNFAEISAPLQAWYNTPAGGEPVIAEGAGDEGEIQLDLIEEAMEEGEAVAPEGALGSENDTEGTTDSATATESESDSVEEAAPTSPAGPDEDESSGLGWVAPAAIVGLALVGGGVLLARRREQ